MATIAESPGTAFYAFSPVRYLVRGVDGDRWGLTLADSFGEEVKIEAETFNGVADVDVSGVVRKMFRDKRELLSGNLNTLKVWRDFNLCVFFKDDIYALSRMALNGASPLGKGSDILTSVETDALRFLTTFGKLRYYTGYELTATLAFIRGTVSLIYRSLDGEEFVALSDFDPPMKNALVTDDCMIIELTAPGLSMEANSGTQYIPLLDFADNPITAYPNELITVKVTGVASGSLTLPVIHSAPPAHPFYIRWINRIGGYDYWMFGCREYVTHKLTELREALLFIVDSAQTAQAVTYAKTGEDTISVSTGQIGLDDLKVLSLMPYSPKIEWYNEDIKKWMKIEVDGDTEVAYGVHEPGGEIEFTFILPKPQMQF